MPQLDLKSKLALLVSSLIGALAFFWSYRFTPFLSRTVDVDVEVHISRATILIGITASTLVSGIVIYVAWFRKAIGKPLSYLAYVVSDSLIPCYLD